MALGGGGVAVAVKATTTLGSVPLFVKVTLTLSGT
jgi:hypothetical protein